jgi:hypothetical protein
MGEMMGGRKRDEHASTPINVLIELIGSSNSSRAAEFQRLRASRTPSFKFCFPEVVSISIELFYSHWDSLSNIWGFSMAATN